MWELKNGIHWEDALKRLRNGGSIYWRHQSIADWVCGLSHTEGQAVFDRRYDTSTSKGKITVDMGYTSPTDILDVVIDLINLKATLYTDMVWVESKPKPPKLSGADTAKALAEGKVVGYLTRKQYAMNCFDECLRYKMDKYTGEILFQREEAGEWHSSTSQKFSNFFGDNITVFFLLEEEE